MAHFDPLPFQKHTIDELTEMFVRLWAKREMQLSLVLKAPTGSGKTFTSAHFINELNCLPNWNEDKAFIWITFSDDLAMQSKEKFNDYFRNTLRNDLLTVNDINNGKLKNNDVLFLNWQKIVTRSAKNRVLRRPGDPEMRKESGSYWEDFIDQTHEDHREIILIIDEAHKNARTTLAQDRIDYINPKIIYKITATPSDQDELEARRYNSFCEVDRQRVVDEGLIKEKIVVQTNEDLERHSGEDLDKALLDLGIEKKEELTKQFEDLGKNVNPLVLIQLPNDDKELRDRGEKTKEEVVIDYLREKGVHKNHIALWFDKHKKNLEFITENDSDVDFMLFKQAAGTGWDCPRAHVLIMFREISSHTFYAQTVGRILRMSEPQKKDSYKNSPDLRTGFLFTNYERHDITDEYSRITGNKPFIHTAQLKLEFKEAVKDFRLESSFLSRVDYGDLADSVKFQKSFIESMNEYFGVVSDNTFDKAQKKLEEKGIDLTPTVTNRLIVNAEYSDFDQLSLDFERKGEDSDFQMSQNDIQKTFNFLCYQVIKEQTDEDSRISNIARSWPPLKRALRVWLRGILGPNYGQIYRVFVYDVLRNASSKFRPAITQALKEYHPILKKILEERLKKQKEREAPIYGIKESYRYTEDYFLVGQNNCVMDRCYLRDYAGRQNEIDFLKYIDGKTDWIEWWVKNGDSGKDAYSLTYLNTSNQRDRLFYPDWIIQFRNGNVGILDTKAGRTLSTEGRAKGLAEKLQELGDNYVGGIARFANGIWEYCNSPYYNDSTPSNNNWKRIEELFE